MIILRGAITFTNILPFKTRISICESIPKPRRRSHRCLRTSSLRLASPPPPLSTSTLGVTTASAAAVVAHTLLPLMRGGQVLIGRRGRRRRRRRAKGWRNRQAPSRGPAATVSSRRASSQRPAAVSTRRKDGHDGWHGRP